MKLENLVVGNNLIITQTNHGASQNGMAFDFGHLAGQAQADGKIIRITSLYQPKLDKTYPYRQSYFHFIAADGSWYIQYVHALPSKALNAIYKRGEVLWASKWHHVHPAIVYQNKWGVLLDYMRRDIELWWTRMGLKHPVWTNWSTYRDLHLPPLPIIMKSEMVTLQHKLKCKTTNTTALKIRREPNIPSVNPDSNVIGTIPSSVMFETQVVANGTIVEGNPTWYKYSDGFISGRWVEELQSGNTAELEKELAAEKIKTTTLITENTTLKSTVSTYRPAYEAAKLIQNTK
jgi:hypothetical protein